MYRGGSIAAATSKMERFVIITKRSILDVTAVLVLDFSIRAKIKNSESSEIPNFLK